MSPMIPNLFKTDPVTRIFERLYIGTLYGADLLRYGNRDMITMVINCTKDPLPDIPGVKQIILNLDDGQKIPETTLRVAIINMTDEIQRVGGRVLVVCAAGISRSTTILLSYLYLCGMAWDEAFELVRKFRPIVMPHPELVRSAKKTLKIFPYDKYDC